MGFRLEVIKFKRLAQVAAEVWFVVVLDETVIKEGDPGEELVVSTPHGSEAVEKITLRHFAVADPVLTSAFGVFRGVCHVPRLSWRMTRIWVGPANRSTSTSAARSPFRIRSASGFGLRAQSPLDRFQQRGLSYPVHRNKEGRTGFHLQFDLPCRPAQFDSRTRVIIPGPLQFLTDP